MTSGKSEGFLMNIGGAALGSHWTDTLQSLYVRYMAVAEMAQNGCDRDRSREYICILVTQY